jgi:DNA-binding transcriptional LysR family regulator
MAYNYPVSGKLNRIVMDVQLNDIALYVEVAKRKNFSRAAQALDIPTSTLSRRVSELERGIGMRLLNRSTRRIDLTEAGKIYYERCRHLVDEARVAHEQLASLSGQPKGKLRISISTSLAQLFLPAVMGAFARKYPDIECDFDLSARAIDPISNPFDVALRFGAQPDSNLIARRLVLMPNQLYASPEYLAANGVPQAPQDLAHHQCLRQTRSKAPSVWTLHSGNTVERVEVSGQMSASHAGVLGRLASSGMGITSLPVFDAMRRAIEQSGLVRVLPEWHLSPIPLYALLPTRNPPAKTTAFLDFIEPHLHDSGATAVAA